METMGKKLSDKLRIALFVVCYTVFTACTYVREASYDRGSPQVFGESTREELHTSPVNRPQQQ